MSGTPNPGAKVRNERVSRRSLTRTTDAPVVLTNWFFPPALDINLVGAFGLGEAGGYRRNSVSGHTGILESFGQWTNTSAADLVLSSSTSTPTGRPYAVFNSTDQSYLQRPNDSWISLDGIPWSGVVHVRMDSLSQDQFIATQTIFSGSNRGWQIYYSQSDNRFKFGMSTTGADMQTVLANNFGAPSTATWYTLAFGWDGTRIWISVNGGARNTTAVASAMFNTTAEIRIGYRDGLPLDAGVAGLYLWTRTILDADIAYIHNGGTYQPPITIVTPSTYWEGSFETGDLTELTLDSGGSEQTSGTFSSTDSTAQAHTGTHSRKATVTGASGVRYFRNREIEAYSDTEVSAWFYIPSLITVSAPDYWNNIFQFKSDPGTGSEPMWYLSIANRGGGAMYLRLYDWQTSTWYEQGSTDLPVATWFKISARYKNGVTDGFVTFAQDDKIIFHKKNVKTIFSGKTAIWSVNNYTGGQTPSPADIYIDDMAVYSPVLVGPEVSYRDLFRGALGGASGGAASYNETGGGVSGFVGSGSDILGFTETGQGTSGFTGSGSDILGFTEAGTGVSGFVGSASELFAAIDAGQGTSGLTGSGADAYAAVDAGQGTSGFAGSGSDVLAVTETGSGVSGFTGSAGDTAGFVDAGSGVSGLAGSAGDVGGFVDAAAGVSGFTGSAGDVGGFVDAADGVSGLVGSGSELLTMPDAGSGVSGLTGSGADAYAAVDAGSGVSGFVGSGADAYAAIDAGSGISGLTGSGSDTGAFIDAGSGVTSGAGSALDVLTMDDAGTGVLAGVGSGADSTSASYDETGGATSAFIGSASDVATMDDAGQGTTALTAGAVDVGTVTDAGAAASALFGGAVDVLTMPDAGSGVSGLSASGSDAYALIDAGSAASAFFGGGSDVFVMLDAGDGVSAFTGSALDIAAMLDDGTGVLAGVGSGLDQLSAFALAVTIHTFDARGVHHYTRTRIGTHSFDARGVHHYRERKS